LRIFAEGCFVCGKPIVYFEEEKPISCQQCGKAFNSTVACEDGHYICDSCHEEQGFVFITQYVSTSQSIAPIAMATDIMRNQFINMHGPEHHYLIAAVLLAAYRNAGGEVDFDKALKIAQQRAKKVPGGICGTWGSCGAAVSTGIFISIVTGASPLSEKEWSLANQMTSQSLELIASNGGPRCCKRNTYLGITQAITFLKEKLNIYLESPQSVVCRFSHRNKQCRNEKCLYFPRRAP